MKNIRLQYILIPAMLIVLTGCSSFPVVSPHMADSQNYVRQHKGEGLRRSLPGSEAELMDTVVKNLEMNRDGTGDYYTIYTIVREPHMVLAK